jgi:hypothetical protein
MLLGVPSRASGCHPLPRRSSTLSLPHALCHSPSNGSTGVLYACCWECPAVLRDATRCRDTAPLSLSHTLSVTHHRDAAPLSLPHALCHSPSSRASGATRCCDAAPLSLSHTLCVTHRRDARGRRWPRRARAPQRCSARRAAHWAACRRWKSKRSAGWRRSPKSCAARCTTPPGCTPPPSARCAFNAQAQRPNASAGS